jgi:hypothetical protein
MELLVIAIYAGILALVTPFVMPPSGRLGKLVPLGVSVVAGSALWLILTWFGFRYEEAWIWFIVMLGMPAATFFAVRYLDSKREREETAELERIRLSGKA